MLVREPLTHFLLAGIALFVYFELVGSPLENDDSSITVTADDINLLRATWLEKWRRLPTQAELEGLIDNTVKEEVFYREGLRLGLDQGDAVVRNRMIQKVRFLTSESVPEPTQQDLQNWLDDHQGEYQTPDAFTLSQIYLGRGRSEAEIKDLVEQLTNVSGAVEQQLLDGARQALSVPEQIVDQSSAQLAKTFGQLFVDGLRATTQERPIQEWSQRWIGPIYSGFGSHLVRITAHTPSRLSTLEDPLTVQRVSNDWRSAQLKRIEKNTLDAMMERYELTIETGS